MLKGLKDEVYKGTFTENMKALKRADGPISSLSPGIKRLMQCVLIYWNAKDG